ncbi:MAG: phenylalanine--tRNA ligase subunit alpha [Pseudomonadota bacterium]
MTVSNDVAELEATWLPQIETAPDLAALDGIRVAALGKKGDVSGRMKLLGKMTPEERQIAGPALNGLKTRLTEAVAERKAALEAEALAAKLAAEREDMTLDPMMPPPGTIHPVSQVMDEIAEIFASMGFMIAEGPEIEDDFHNFTALNIPLEHPARQMHDTFYIAGDEGQEPLVLRTHTSPVQVRTMLGQKPPVRVIAPGRTFRCDSDATHTPMFHQFEGLVIDSSTHMGHLKGCLDQFVRTFFEVDEVRMRFRPSYFPFTEPSAELDIGCSFSGGQVQVGEGDDWLEILGCGMVHPNVLRAVGYDPDEVQGFAFGCGIDRLAMLKYGMTDLRAFFDADLRWLKHYGFRALDVPTIAGGLGT